MILSFVVHSGTTIRGSGNVKKANKSILAAYHSKLKKDEKEEAQRKWTSGEIQAVAATIAFGSVLLKLLELVF
jgi:hypothetical protein